MKSIKPHLNNVELLNPNFSSYLSFANAVKGKKFSLTTLQKNFNILVDKNDYQIEDKSKLISNLYSLSNPIEEEELEGKNDF